MKKIMNASFILTAVLIASISISGCGGSMPPVDMPDDEGAEFGPSGGPDGQEIDDGGNPNENLGEADPNASEGDGKGGGGDDPVASPLNQPGAMVAVGDVVYVLDGGSRTIKRIDGITDDALLPDVYTLGFPDDASLTNLVGGHGYADSADGAPKFGHFYGIAELDGVLYIADTQNTSIRRVILNLDGSVSDVSTIAGAKPVKGGYTDGIGLSARFLLPHGIAAGDDELFVADTYNHVIRHIDLIDMNVTTVAGAPGAAGFVDANGAAAKFNRPSALAIDDDYLYIVDQFNNRIRRMDLVTHEVDTLAGNGTAATVDGTGEDAGFDSPRAIDYFGGYLYIAEGATLPGISPRDGGGVLRRIDTSTAEVETIAGRIGIHTPADGTFDEASFDNPTGVLYIPGKGILVSDEHANSIRLVSYQSQEVDTTGFCGDEPELANEVQQPIVVTVDAYKNAEGKHLLLPRIELTAAGIDISTVAKDALRVKIDGADLADYTLATADIGNSVKLIFGNGADGTSAWVPNAKYTIKLCHQIETEDGVPIEPKEIVIYTRKPNELEDIGISHSGGTRSGKFYLPKDYDPSEAYPMAVLLHGLGGNGAGMVSEFTSLADSMNVILLGPDGFLRKDPFGNSNLYYFNPNHKNTSVPDFDFVINCLNKMLGAFDVDGDQLMVAGMSMGAPATLFFAGHEGQFSHAAMLHGVRWNYDPNSANDVANIFFMPWEQTPLGTYRPLFWYSTSVDDWVTNYSEMQGMGLTVAGDLAYVEGGGYDVTHKFDYPGGHWMTAGEKQDLFEWFLFGTAP